MVVNRGAAPLTVAVYRVPELEPGDTIAGPALLDDVDTTIWVPPDAAVHLDPYRNAIVEMGR